MINVIYQFIECDKVDPSLDGSGELTWLQKEVDNSDLPGKRTWLLLPNNDNPMYIEELYTLLQFW